MAKVKNTTQKVSKDYRNNWDKAFSNKPKEEVVYGGVTVGLCKCGFYGTLYYGICNNCMNTNIGTFVNNLHKIKEK